MRLIFTICVWILMSVVAFAQDGLRISVPLYDGGAEVRYVSMIIRGDSRYIDGMDLRDWVQTNLNMAANTEFENALNANVGAFPVGLLSGVRGFWVQYDDARGFLILHVTPQVLKMRTLSMQPEYLNEAKVAVRSDIPTAYLNTYAGMDYVHRSTGETGRQALRLDMDGAISSGRFVLEGRADYDEHASQRKWRRGNVRLVHDNAKDMVRYAAGDLSYPVVGFQSFAPMAGASLARNFTLQPYLITEPTGQTSFMLTSPSRVEVYVNDMMIRVMQLNPGPYDVSDFPVLDGANDVRLVITDAAGRQEVMYFPLVSDQALLKKGLHEYSYNVGVRSDDVNREIRYETNRPAFSAFHRYGVTDNLTAGASLQGDKDVQQAGVHVVTTHTWGTVSVDGAMSHMDKYGADGAVQVGYSYRHKDGRNHVSVSMDYKGPNFSTLGDEVPFNRYSWGVAARYAQPMGPYNMNVGGRYREGREGYQNDWSYGLGMSRVLPYNLIANVNFEHRKVDGAGVVMGISWTPGTSRNRVYASADTLAKYQDVRWAWNDGKKLDVGVGLRRDEHRQRGEGHAEYRGSRGQVGIHHDISRIVTPDRKPILDDRGNVEQRTRLTGAMGIAFAKKYVAISKPIHNGFIMVRKHESLDGYNVGIDPIYSQAGVTTYDESIDALGPAVISDATPYMYRNFGVDVRNLPTDYELDKDQFVAMPSYKSGVLVTVGTMANVHIDGHLEFANGDAVGLRAGVVKPVGTHSNMSEQEFFTNGEGRFRVTRLEPGDYVIVLYDAPDDPIQFTIPADTKPGRYNVGVLVVPEIM